MAGDVKTERREWKRISKRYEVETVLFAAGKMRS